MNDLVYRTFHETRARAYQLPFSDIWMNPVTRKALFIVLGAMVVEAWPMAIVVLPFSGDRMARVFEAPTAIWPAWITAALVAACYVAYSMRALPLIRERFLEAHPLKLLVIPFALITGTVEEFWFRRVLMDWVAGSGAGWALEVIFSALAFGVVHAIWGLFGGNWRVALNAMLATTGLGAALAIVYLIGNRHIAPCIWSHVCINLAIEPWLIVSAISFDDKSQSNLATERGA